MRGALYFLLSSALAIAMVTTGAVLSASNPQMAHWLIESAPLVFIGLLTLALSSKVIAARAGVDPVLHNAVASILTKY